MKNGFAVNCCCVFFFFSSLALFFMLSFQQISLSLVVVSHMNLSKKICGFFLSQTNQTLIISSLYERSELVFICEKRFFLVFVLCGTLTKKSEKSYDGEFILIKLKVSFAFTKPSDTDEKEKRQQNFFHFAKIPSWSTSTRCFGNLIISVKIVSVICCESRYTHQIPTCLLKKSHENVMITGERRKAMQKRGELVLMAFSVCR